MGEALPIEWWCYFMWHTVVCSCVSIWLLRLQNPMVTVHMVGMALAIYDSVRSKEVKKRKSPIELTLGKFFDEALQSVTEHQRMLNINAR